MITKSAEQFFIKISPVLFPSVEDCLVIELLVEALIQRFEIAQDIEMASRSSEPLFLSKLLH